MDRGKYRGLERLRLKINLRSTWKTSCLQCLEKASSASDGLAKVCVVNE